MQIQDQKINTSYLVSFKKYFLTMLYLCFIVISSFAQQNTIAENEKNRIDSINTSYILIDSSKTIEEKLVALAMLGPLFSETEHMNKINEYQLKGAKDSWLNLLSLSANYNDQTFAKRDQDLGNPIVYPKFFTGINIPLGVIFSRTNIKAAKEQISISKNRQDQLARAIKVDILSRYNQFLTLKQLVINQREVVDDYQAAFLQAKQKFSDNLITIELHNTASKNFNDETAKLLNLQLQQSTIQLEIEKIIGVNLESVLKPTFKH